MTEPRIEFRAAPLEQVVEFLRKVSKTSIHVKWTALDQAGISRQTPVNVMLTDVTLAKALEVVLQEVSGPVRLGYMIDQGVITISTRDDLSLITVTLVYDVSGLEDGPVWTPAQKVLVKQLLRQALNEPLPKQANLTLAEAYHGQLDKLTQVVEMLARRQRREELAEFVREAVDPDTWREHSGTTGSIQLFRDQPVLVITQTHQAHQTIADLLATLSDGPVEPARSEDGSSLAKRRNSHDAGDSRRAASR